MSAWDPSSSYPPPQSLSPQDPSLRRPRAPRVAVFGAGGYTGALLCQLLDRHPGVELALIGSARLVDEGPGSYADWGLRRAPPLLKESAARDACADLGIEVAALATPHEASLELTPHLLAAGVRVLDLSGAFRLKDPEAFQRAYGMRHPFPELLADACWVLPEVTGTAALGSARLVANPGCYVTAALLALAPLWRAGLLRPGAPIFIDGKSGATGAGRKGTVPLSLSELHGDLRPYRVGAHQHTPEIVAGLDGLDGRGATPVSPMGSAQVYFTPHLVGVPRGLLVTCHAQLRDGVSPAEVPAALLHNYADCPRIRCVPVDQVSLRRPVGTPDAWVGAQAVGATVCAAASLDNLLKGAASQALQNLNGMLGLADGAGLDALWSI